MSGSSHAPQLQKKQVKKGGRSYKLYSKQPGSHMTAEYRLQLLNLLSNNHQKKPLQCNISTTLFSQRNSLPLSLSSAPLSCLPLPKAILNRNIFALESIYKMTELALDFSDALAKRTLTQVSYRQHLSFQILNLEYNTQKLYFVWSELLIQSPLIL